MIGTHRNRAPLAATFLLLWPAAAHAHLVSTGFGPFYDGVTHLVMSPDDLLAVLALALLSGLLGARHGRAALFTLPATWLIGGLVGVQLERTLRQGPIIGARRPYQHSEHALANLRAHLRKRLAAQRAGERLKHGVDDGKAG